MWIFLRAFHLDGSKSSPAPGNLASNDQNVSFWTERDPIVLRSYEWYQRPSGS